MAPEEDIGRAIIGAAIKIHTAVGPGLLESAYEACLIYELEKQRLRVQRQLSVRLRYEEIVVEQGYRLDLLVDGLVVVELKTVPAILPVHRSQLLGYLRLGNFKLGYILNFHVAQMRDGILRMVNGLLLFASSAESLRSLRLGVFV